MTVKTPENPLYCGSQNGKAKSKLVARVARLVRQAGLTYEDWRYVSRRVRQKCDLHPAAKPKKLPRILTADQFRAFYKAVDEADDVQHSLMLRLLFYTGVRVSELCAIEVADIDLENCKIFVNQGKGSKDRYVLFGKSFAMALRAHIAAHPDNRYLFQTRRCGRFSTRRVQQVVRHNGWTSRSRKAWIILKGCGFQPPLGHHIRKDWSNEYECSLRRFGCT